MDTNVKENIREEILEGRRQPETSPLYAIQQKEIEINSDTLRVKKQAEKIVAKARKQALEIREKAERHAVSEAKKISEREIAKANKQAGLILDGEEAQIEKIINNGKKSMKQAISDITDAVLGR